MKLNKKNKIIFSSITILIILFLSNPNNVSFEAFAKNYANAPLKDIKNDNPNIKSANEITSCEYSNYLIFSLASYNANTYSLFYNSVIPIGGNYKRGPFIGILGNWFILNKKAKDN